MFQQRRASPPPTHLNLNGTCRTTEDESGFADDVVLPLDPSQDLADLKGLSLRSNGLQHFPVSVLQLTSLTTLDLSDNRLLTLPPEVGALKK